MDMYLRFADDAEANAALYTVHPAQVDRDGNEVAPAYTTPNYANIDILGVIYERSTDHDAKPVTLPGWHVNVRVVGDEDGSKLAQFAVHPASPRRVWA